MKTLDRYSTIRLMELRRMAMVSLVVPVAFWIVSVQATPVHAEGARRELATTPYPRIAMLWAPVRGQDTMASMVQHDLVMSSVGAFGLRYVAGPTGLAERFTDESILRAKKRLAEIKRGRPDAIVLVEVYFYEYRETWLPEDHPWWLRKDGKRQQFWPGTYRMDWNNPEYRGHVVKVTAALDEVGFDGVFYDNLREEPEPWVAFLKQIRQAVSKDFLVLANVGYSVGRHDFAAPYLNGIMYESGWSHGRAEWGECISRMQCTESLLREPKISVIERFEETRSRAGWPGDAKRGQKPTANPRARRWTLCYALAIGDFYYLFSDNTSHRHDWYPEYDMKIGMPTGAPERVSSHLWRRQYEKALVVVNLPGADQPFDIQLPQPATDALTGRLGTHFRLQPADGVILLEKE